MGRQLKYEDRSLREIHGTAAPGSDVSVSASVSPRSHRRSRSSSNSSSRSRTMSPPRSLRGFGNLWSPSPRPPQLPQQQPRPHAGAANSNGTAMRSSRNVKHWPPLQMTMLKELGEAMAKAPSGLDTDTIVGVSNGGAYTIGPLYKGGYAAAAAGQGPRAGMAAGRGLVQKRKMAVVMPLFMLANVAYFMATMYLNNCQGHACVGRFLHRFSFQPLEENPLLGPSSGRLAAMGAVGGEGGWRLLSSLWLHAGLLHLLTTVAGLGVVGIRLERDLGYLSAGLAYVVAGVGGSLLSALLYSGEAAGGGSGALLGVLGATGAEMATNWSNYRGKGRVLGCCALLLAACACQGVMPNVGNWSHLGGSVTGFLLAFVFLVRPHLWTRPAHSGYDPDDALHSPGPHTLVWALALLLLVGFYAGTVIALLAAGSSARAHCQHHSFCRHLTCIPTSRWHCNYFYN